MKPKKTAKARRSTVGRDPFAKLNPLDELVPDKAAPNPKPEPPAKVRATFHLPEELMDEARGAALSTALALRHTVSSLVEVALREKLERLRKSHNGGKPFPHVGAGEGMPTGRPQAGRRQAANA
jgi:hypothetical protein